MNMQSLTWLKPALYGVACGAIAVAIVGFQWGGWVTGSHAKLMATSEAETAVVRVLMPFCLDFAKRDPDYANKLIEMKKAPSYNRRDFVVKAGWGTKSSDVETNTLVDRACADKLLQ
jgi:hypothetical protein